MLKELISKPETAKFFTDPGVLLHVHSTMANFSFSAQARKFIHEVFEGALLNSPLTTAATGEAATAGATGAAGAGGEDGGRKMGKIESASKAATRFWASLDTVLTDAATLHGDPLPGVVTENVVESVSGDGVVYNTNPMAQERAKSLRSTGSFRVDQMLSATSTPAAAAAAAAAAASATTTNRPSTSTSTPTSSSPLSTTPTTPVVQVNTAAATTTPLPVKRGTPPPALTVNVSPPSATRALAASPVSPAAPAAEEAKEKVVEDVKGGKGEQGGEGGEGGPRELTAGEEMAEVDGRIAAR